MSSLLRRLVITVGVLGHVVGHAAEPSARTFDEIAHLMWFLDSSGCEFYRNGTWYSSDQARLHLVKKNKHLLDRGLVNTAEDFIAKAATSSSLSGQPYLVRCQRADPVPSALWLGAELERYRAFLGTRRQ